MSTMMKSVVYLIVAFAVTWAIVIAAWSAGLHENPQLAPYTLALSMFGPAVAALICAFAFEKGRRVTALGLRFKPNWWWLLAWLIPVLLAAASVGITIAFSQHAYVDPATGVINATRAVAPEAVAQLEGIPYLGVLIMVQALVVGALINSVILTISEELGWRGYLYDLWRGAGFWRYSLATGAIWGVWHAPMIFLFGHNYPDQPVLGIGLFTLFCILLSPIMTMVRDRGKSVWSAGIFHGTFNALGGLTILLVGGAAFPWSGIVGIGGFAALALGLVIVALMQRGQPEPPQATATA